MTDNIYNPAKIYKNNYHFKWQMHTHNISYLLLNWAFGTPVDIETHCQYSLLAYQHGTVCQVCESLMCAWHFYTTMWPTLLGNSSLSHVCIILTYILRSEFIERNLPSRLFLNLMRGGGEGDHLKYGCYGRCCKHARAIHGQEYSTSVHVLGTDGKCVGFYGKYVTGGIIECQMASASYFTD